MNTFLFKIEKCQNPFLFNKIGKFSNWKVSETESTIRVGKFQNWEVSESTKFKRCQNWKVSETAQIGTEIEGMQRRRAMKSIYGYPNVSYIESGIVETLEQRRQTLGKILQSSRNVSNPLGMLAKEPSWGSSQKTKLRKQERSEFLNKIEKKTWLEK